jgi:hydrogenase maturation protease
MSDDAETVGRVLLIGFGNPGRLDDGLGPELARIIETRNLPGVTVEADYQLTVEDAADVAQADVVVFADADVAGPEPFWLAHIQPAADAMSFSSHSVEPQAVLALARDLFHAEPRAYLMGIRGYAFNEFGERLSDGARANLDAAVEYLEAAIRNGRFREVRPEGASPARPADDNQ